MFMANQLVLDTQQNDTQQNDTQHNDTRQNDAEWLSA